LWLGLVCRVWGAGVVSVAVQRAAVLLDDFLRVEWHSRLSKRMAGYEAMEDDAA
jgi:hypothetical protein